jgi:hypothetical protein
METHNEYSNLDHIHSATVHAARTHHAWQDREIADGLLHEVYDLAKWGPTSANSLPMRIVFVKSNSAKEKLMPALAGSNVEQVRAALVTAIVADDQKFYDQLPTLFPAFDARSLFASNPSLSGYKTFLGVRPCEPVGICSFFAAVLRILLWSISWMRQAPCLPPSLLEELNHV